MNIKKTVLSTVAVALLAGASIFAAQKATEPAIGGYCPVAYQAAGKAQKGDPKVTSTFDGQTFRLTNGMVKEMFDKDPAKYAPAYKGFCAAAVAKGMKLKANPELFSVVDGKTYLFSTPEAKKMFEMDKTGMIAMANQNWPTVEKLEIAK